MPPWPIAMPSSTAIVLNSLATPPAATTDSATISPTLRRCTWPGTNWVKEFATATIGLPKSDSVIPVARHSARAPAMFRPCVEVRDRSAGHGRLLAYRPSLPRDTRWGFSHLVRGADQVSHGLGRVAQVGRLPGEGVVRSAGYAATGSAAGAVPASSAFTERSAKNAPVGSTPMTKTHMKRLALQPSLLRPSTASRT